MCCCLVHVETALLLECLNCMRRENILHGHHCDCMCAVCGGHEGLGERTGCTGSDLTYIRLTVFWESCLCLKEMGRTWHNRECLLGDCVMFGVSRMFPTCPGEEFGDTIVKWRCYSDVVVGVNERTGDEKRRIREQYKETPSSEFFRYFKPKLSGFIRHNYIARWQDLQASLALESLPENTILSHMDFAENYGFQVANEVQTEYYHSFQVTIMVHITFRINPEYARDNTQPRIIKEQHYWISDDPEHDTLYVQHCFGLHWRWLRAKGLCPTEHWVFSDGCARQFKSRRPMFYVAKYPGIADGCRMRWEYFGTGHGKG